MNNTSNSLNDEDRAMLDFERDWPHMQAPNKDAEIRDRFDMTTVEYYGALANLLNDPAARTYDGITVQRLKRLRAQSDRDRDAEVIDMSHRRTCGTVPTDE